MYNVSDNCFFSMFIVLLTLRLVNDNEISNGMTVLVMSFCSLTHVHVMQVESSPDDTLMEYVTLKTSRKIIHEVTP